MRFSALSAVRKLFLSGAAVALLSLAAAACHAQPDPPAQAGRLSYTSGQVSVQPAGVDDWGQAYPNQILGPGDRVATDNYGRAEIQVGQTFVRIGPNSDVSLVDSTPEGLYFGVAQGTIHLRTFGLWQDQAVYVNTPSGSSTLSMPGELRVDVYPDQNAALFTSYAHDLFLSGAGGFEQDLGNNQALELVGSNPVVPQWVQPADWDELDHWSHVRDQQISQARSYRYVSPEVPGAYELDANGDWRPDSPYGPVWFPRNVPYGWAPYHYGHWVNHAPWGWVWVEDESWGYAPFHYGRWVSWEGRWGWVPGPPAAHPVWSPALVVFAGGIHVGGVGVSAWFPLGPGEAYHPWYKASPRYMDQVNITNIVEAPRVHVQTTYVNINVVNITYVNRTTVTAMRQEDFASGRPAHQANVVVDVHQMDHVQVLAAPEPKPTQQSFVGHPPAHPINVSVARPVLINEKGMAIAAKPGAVAIQPPVKPAPPIKVLPGHTVIAPPPNAAKPGPQNLNQPLNQPRPPVPPAGLVTKPQPGPPTPPKPAAEPAPRTVPTPLERPAAQPAPKPVPPFEPTPAAKPAPPPPAKPTPPPLEKPAAPAPRTVPTPLEKPAAQPAPKPVPPFEPRPEAKPAPPSPPKPTPPPAERPAAPAPVKPPAPPAAKPPVNQAAPPAANKPGTPPPANNDKNKDKNQDNKNPQ